MIAAAAAADELQHVHSLCLLDHLSHHHKSTSNLFLISSSSTGMIFHHLTHEKIKECIRQRYIPQNPSKVMHERKREHEREKKKGIDEFRSLMSKEFQLVRFDIEIEVADEVMRICAI